MSFLRTGARAVGRFILGRIGKLVAWPIRRRLYAFEAATQQPRAAQEALLQRILASQRDTAFGRDHHFEQIRTLEDFRRQVAVAGYERMEPYITRMRRGEFSALVANQTVHMFALTSGTTASRKYIPVTSQYLADYKRGWNIWGLKVYRDHPLTRWSPIVQVSGDWNEFTTEAGTPCGAVTGLTARTQKRIIRWLYCIPGCVAEVKDPAAKYYLILRLSMCRKVTLAIAANPSTFVNLARIGDREKESLIRDIRDGTLSGQYEIPAHVREALHHRIRKPNPVRARELEQVVARTGTLYPKDYWPEYCVLGNWMGGSMGAYLRHYPRYFGSMPIRDVGLIASEGRMTIPLADGSPSGVLDITTHFFEFIPEDEADSPQPTVLRADEVMEGRSYFIIPTTAAGLYRYNISDVVRVTGFYNRTPLIEFLSKGSHFSNLTGEKLSEHQVTRSMQEALRELDLSVGTYSVAPCWPAPGEPDELTPYYGLLVERTDLPGLPAARALAEALDRRLSLNNEEYAAKRTSRRLGPVRTLLLPPGTWHEWDQNRLQRTGGTLEQYKHPCLINDQSLKQSLPVEQEAGGPTSRLAVG